MTAEEIRQELKLVFSSVNGGFQNGLQFQHSPDQVIKPQDCQVQRYKYVLVMHYEQY